MKKLLVILCVVLLVFSFAGVAKSVVLTFDDITSLPGQSQIPDGYGGFHWEKDTSDGTGATAIYLSNIPTLTDPGYQNTGWLNSLVSGDFVGWNNNGDPAWIFSVSGSFDFNGTYFTAAYNDGLNITLDGYLDDQLLYSSTIIVDTTSPIWFDFNYLGINKMKMTPFGGIAAPGIPYSGDDRTHFAMDNFTFNANPVPEPATMLLLGSGIIGLAGLRKRR